jgi:hypothetical protein
MIIELKKCGQKMSKMVTLTVPLQGSQNQKIKSQIKRLFVYLKEKLLFFNLPSLMSQQTIFYFATKYLDFATRKPAIWAEFNPKSQKNEKR